MTHEKTGRGMGDVMDAAVANMKERTGRSLEERVQVVLDSGIAPHDLKAVRRWLKEQQSAKVNTRSHVAEAVAKAAGWRRPSMEAFIDQLFAGSKAGMGPLFDRLRAVSEDLGDDVTVQGREVTRRSSGPGSS